MEKLTENQETMSSVDQFKKSLTELRDLHSQLHHAADYCEGAFLKAKQKKMVMEHTKSYICQAIVTVIDHLGTVSANMEQKLSENNEVSDTEQRIDCLKQRLLTCQQYAVNFDLIRFRWNTRFPRHHLHYTSALASPLQKTNAVIVLKDSEITCKKDRLPAVDGRLTFDFGVKAQTPDNGSKSGKKFLLAVPVIEGPMLLSKKLSPLFGFNAKEDHSTGLSEKKKKKKNVQKSPFPSVLQKSKRKA